MDSTGLTRFKRMGRIAGYEGFAIIMGLLFSSLRLERPKRKTRILPRFAYKRRRLKLEKAFENRGRRINPMRQTCFFKRMANYGALPVQAGARITASSITLSRHIESGGE